MPLIAVLGAIALAGFGPAAAETEAAPQAKAPIVYLAPGSAAIHRGVHAQLQAGEPLVRRYPKASTIGLAIAVVPDPLVPRYRRAYDLAIKAIELGMLKAGYVLDRYAFPWSEELRKDTTVDEAAASANAHGAADAGSAQRHRRAGSYGLMVFRCDKWRRSECASALPNTCADPAAGASIRAIYVVTDTATMGVATHQLAGAIGQIRAQLPPAGQAGPNPRNTGAAAAMAACPPPLPASAEVENAQATSPRVSLLAFPLLLCQKDGSRPTLVVLGPDFSGAMDSVGQATASIGFPELKICLVSSSATEATNVRVKDRYPWITYTSLALSDEEKLLDLAQLAQAFGIYQPSGDAQEDALPGGTPRRPRIAILAEASTFGYGVCGSSQVPGAGGTDPPAEPAAQVDSPDAQRRRFCREASIFYFPATIADIRYGLAKLQAQQTNEVSGAARQIEDSQHLPLEVGAENGSEFPESEQSELTSASDELELDRNLAELAAVGPRMVVVVATDVRDRLFLFDQLRQMLPRAMLVDLEADNLLTHPDFLHASRGALAVASAEMTVKDSQLFGCERRDRSFAALSSWSMDVQGILADAVSRLYVADDGQTPTPCVASDTRHRRAVLQVATLEGLRSVSRGFTPATDQEADPLSPGPLLAAKAYAPVFCAALSCLWLYPCGLRRVRRRATSPAGAQETWNPSTALALALAAPMLVIAPAVAYASSRAISHPLVYCVLAIESLGLWGAYRCYGAARRAARAAPEQVSSNWPLAAFLAVLATLVAASAIFAVPVPASQGFVLDGSALTALAFDPTSGLGFYLAIAAASIAVLGASAIVGTRTWIANCGFAILQRAEAAYPGSTPFVSLRIFGPLQADRSQRAWTRVLVLGALMGALTAPGFWEGLGGSRLTIFGPHASFVALLALSATTLCAGILLFAAIASARRIRLVCGYVRGRLLQCRGRGTTAPGEEIPGRWAADADTPVAFAATPVVARPALTGEYGKDLLTREPVQRWAQWLGELLFRGRNEGRHYLALLVLLASEMSLLRWAAAGAVTCALTSVLIAYLYPIEADTLLLLNLLLLAGTGGFCAYVTVVFERDEVLSNVLCDRSKKTEFSIPYFTAICLPFVVLTIAVAVVEIPGVVDWAGGWIAMLRSLGLHP